MCHQTRRRNSKQSVSFSKESLALTDFLAKKMQLVNYCETPLPGPPPPFAIPPKHVNKLLRNPRTIPGNVCLCVCCSVVSLQSPLFGDPEVGPHSRVRIVLPLPCSNFRREQLHASSKGVIITSRRPKMSDMTFKAAQTCMCYHQFCVVSYHVMTFRDTSKHLVTNPRLRSLRAGDR